MIDSHCHLADAAFTGDLDAVVARAQAAGLERVLCVLSAGDADERARSEAVRRRWPAVRFAIGIHPHQAGQDVTRLDERVEALRAELTATPGAVAVGEIGLDYHYDFSPRDIQHDVFRRQVRLARALDLPVVVHTREADADTVRILTEEGRGSLRGVIHCFTGGAGLVGAALDLGFSISFAGIISFPKADGLREVAKLVPADRLLVETDSPYLAPVPYRGKRNEPAWTVEVADRLAATRGERAEDLAAQTTRNFHTLFAR